MQFSILGKDVSKFRTYRVNDKMNPAGGQLYQTEAIGFGRVDQDNTVRPVITDKILKPYVAIGNVSGSKYTDERQTRYRVGVTYNF